MSRIYLSFLFLISSIFNFSQTNSSIKKICGTQVPSNEWNDWFNLQVEEFKNNQLSQKNINANYTIPVVFHIIHGGQGVGTYPNISQIQVNSQVKILNDDFAGIGLNTSNISSTNFSSALISNCNVNFCLAQKNTSGVTLTEPGIDRVNYSSSGWANPTSFSSSTSFRNFIETVVKANTIWDPTRYLNIWISDVNSSVGLLGYATFPSGTSLSGLSSGLGTATTDGIWCWTKSIGDVGTLAPPYDLGRTATHEIGHWLGLRHIWGDAVCGNDFCNDTPTQQDANAGCPTFPSVTCSNGPNGDMFINFMDYCNDACLYMFTPDQRSRMQTAMASCPFRTQLTASSATLCSGTGTSTTCSYTVSNFINTNTLSLIRATASAAETSCAQGSQMAGYICGTNCYGDIEKAEFISSSKYSNATNAKITGVVVLFFNLSSGFGTNGNSIISLKLYDGTSATTIPGSLLASVSENLNNIYNNTINVNNVNYCGDPSFTFANQIIMPYKFVFTTPINAPAGGFFASVTVPNISGDTVAILNKKSSTTNTAWEKWSDNSWHDMNVSWGGGFYNLAILPIIECGAVSVNENTILKNTINLFPNPSSGVFNIITTFSTQQNIQITVHNMLGQLVYVNKVYDLKQNDFELNLNNQPNGVYYVEINNNVEKIVKRVIINK